MTIIWIALQTALAATPGDMAAEPPENVFAGEMVSFPGPWSFSLPRECIILVTDDELRALADPDAVINTTLTHEAQSDSLRKICERGKANGARTIIIAFDHFFAQYRPGQTGKPRELMPDMPEYIDLIAKIGKFAEGYGLGLELSLLSPLEIGPSYARETGESGVWMHYRQGLRDPKTGQYSVEYWRQERWANNKGPLNLADAGVRVFAYNTRPMRGTRYEVVDPNAIVEITDTTQIEVWEGCNDGMAKDALGHEKPGDYLATRVRVHGTGRADIGPLDRVIAVQMYKTPEMDYFSDKALPYLTGLVDRYADAGIKLNALYSDEMHIQSDWRYFNHHDNGEYALRYVSPGFAKAYSEKYGARYADFAKYMVYFLHGQQDFVHDMSAKQDVMMVFGDTPEAIRETALFRSRYFKLLQNNVVDLFTTAKKHAEAKMGYKLESRAHATWAESPTIDYWWAGEDKMQKHQYEYTSNFIWSNTVHQASAACYDYFKWGDFLTGNGNDHAECGWLDRNYTGIALACSTGVLNEWRNSYAAHWGMPNEIATRRTMIASVAGTAPHGGFANLEDMYPRDIDVLTLYPLDLTATDERFGSWMTQYAYSNYVPAAILTERGKVANGAIELKGRRFKTLMAAFEPFPSPELLVMMRDLVAQGGRVIWSGPPPVIDANGAPALADWQALFGVDYKPLKNEGQLAPGRIVSFEGPLAGIAPMPILSDLLMDHVYPATPREGAQVLARDGEKVLGAMTANAAGGQAIFLGFRARDDQSASLGYEARWLFEILLALGAYPATGVFPDANDNTEYLSRTTPYFVCRFPNGAVALAPHLKDVEEDWSGGFARDPEEDKAVMERLNLPPSLVSLKDFKVNGHTVTYEGTLAVGFRTDATGALAAFMGSGSTGITVDGKTTVFAEQAMDQIAWAPVPDDRRVAGGTSWTVTAYGKGMVHIPLAGAAGTIELYRQGPTQGSKGDLVASAFENGVLSFDAAAGGGMLYVVQR